MSQVAPQPSQFDIKSLDIKPRTYMVHYLAIQKLVAVCGCGLLIAMSHVTCPDVM